jgi:hypothetical protein
VSSKPSISTIVGGVRQDADATASGTPRHGLATAVAIVLLMAVSTLASAGWLVGDVHWNNSDSLFYEAQRLEVLGRSAGGAREEVFSSEKARAVALIENQADPPHVLDHAWVEYSAQFYRRRWTVPVIGASIDPIVGERSLQVASFLGYLALGPALFALLRRRFTVRLSFLVAAFCLLLPPVQKWSTIMGVDSWGLAFEILAFLGFVCVIDRGLRWLPLWVAALIALAFTRDAGIALLLGVAWITWRGRASGATRRNLALLASGIAAVAPPLLIFRTPVRDQLAYVINNYFIPTDRTWGFVIEGYPRQFWSTLEWNLGYPLDFPLPLAVPIYAGMIALVVLTLWFLIRSPRDPYFDVHRGAVVGYAIFLALAANPQGYRLELIAVPTLAVALSYWADRALGWRRAVRRTPGPRIRIAGADEARG